MSRLLDLDRFTGIEETFTKDPMTGQVHIKKIQDVEGLLDLNLADKNNANKSWRGDMHKVASIPLIFIEQWREELKAMGAPNINPLARENKNFFIAKLNSRDWAKLRTKEGCI